MNRSLILLGMLLVAEGLVSQSTSGRSLNLATQCEHYSRSVAGELSDEAATKAGFHTVASSGTHLGFTGYKGCGSSMTVQYGEFLSTQDANRFFEWKLGRASKVFTRGPKIDSKGEQVGSRAEILTDQKTVAIIWANGATFRVIYARSLTSAREFEKWYGRVAHISPKY